MFRSQALYISFTITILFTCLNIVQLSNGNEVDEPLTSETELESTTIEVLNFKAAEITFGENVTIVCKTHLQDSIMWWSYQDTNLTDDESYIIERETDNIHADGEKLAMSILHILSMNLEKVGEYICTAFSEKSLLKDEATVLLNVTLSPTTKTSSPVEVDVHKSVSFWCEAEGYPLEDVKWFKLMNPYNSEEVATKEPAKIMKVNELVTNVTFSIDKVTRQDNGTYICSARVGNVISNSSTAILVLDSPQVSIDFVKAIGTDKIYMNWTVNDGNMPQSLKYEVQFRPYGNSEWIYYTEHIDSSSRSAVLKRFQNSTEYTIRMKAENPKGSSQYSISNVTRTLNEEPLFIPEVKVTGMTVSSITISWTTPPPELKDHVHYYKIKSHAGQTSEAIQLASEPNLYLLINLQAATTYQFQVQACSDYSKICGNWSKEVSGTTMDGISGPPENVNVTCRSDNISHASFVIVSWTPPVNPNGVITDYNVLLQGNAVFLNDQGLMENTTWGPKVTRVASKQLNARFYNVSANTNYTISVAGVTRTKKEGQQKTMSCTMPPTVPSKLPLSKFSWGKVEEQGHWMFKLFMPRISERNGPICCYRIYMVRMELHQSLAELPPAEDMPVISYQEAHRTPKGGAYVAEMFTSTTFHQEIFLGDEKVFNITNSMCDHCVGLRPYSTPREHLNSSNSVLHNTRKRRNRTNLMEPLSPYDGTLDINSNYTSFIEIIVHGEHPDQTLAAYSNYFPMMSPGPEVLSAPESNVLGLVVHVLCGLVLLALILLTALCLLHRYTKQTHAQAVEMIAFRTSFRSLRGRQRLVSLNPPDMCPIAKADLLNAYIERHRDTDYGFQHEFELLPDKFTDRTTRASDARENVYKNRYPDIKAYDQTRVRLSQVDSIAGSDYINANFVLGYKERKKFICAQGPMDTTVNDYWRMIWEQPLELILMLTNLEEYSKTKCAKYWPDKTEGEKTFGDITVTHVQETRYSDYIIRELRVNKTSGGSRESEERTITQYHYLVWKDFMAPEHPHGIIKFIKRMNEAYSLERGCILIHCSAGVGRTGTLVALDCLIQQLKEEGQVAIFNTICDLRHQRNFLVQSLKQYIFVYRALVEVAQYGDTEITAVDLKTTLEKLRQCNQDKGQSKLEEEYELIKNAFEDRKWCSVASGEENREKNRSDSVLPYDRNRVILTPLTGKEHSTYINASFIEGYDNSESFIITQDPMENTVADFWRMISEQGISVIVMLSELGDSPKKCLRYWPEDEASYEHITVRYVQAESCPYYTRREMYVRNRDGEDLRVTHLQYHGWPTVDGEMPEVTRGLIELVDHAQSCLGVQNGCSSVPPMVVHCALGSDRSSMFVGLSILVQQLRMERRVDIFTATRKLRSQRQALVSTYAQYEFLYRATVNYAELHNLCDT